MSPGANDGVELRSAGAPATVPSWPRPALQAFMPRHIDSTSYVLVLPLEGTPSLQSVVLSVRHLASANARPVRGFVTGRVTHFRSAAVNNMDLWTGKMQHVECTAIAML